MVILVLRDYKVLIKILNWKYEVNIYFFIKTRGKWE